MNNVEAGRASTEEGSEERNIFHASLILSQWLDATGSSNLIYCYHLKVGMEYSNQKSTKKHYELGDFKDMMDEACSSLIIKEAVTA